MFGALQNFKEDKPQPVRDEYEYVSDDGELKIDEFPIRRKKNAPKRDLSCELGGYGEGQAQSYRAIWEQMGVRRGQLGLTLPKLLPTLLLCSQSYWTRRSHCPRPLRSQSWTRRSIR